MDFTNFSESQVRAWDWIRSAIDEGLNASNSLKAYRAEGGTIGNQEWFRTFRSVSDYADTWETLGTFAPFETVPERFWLEAPRNFANTYVSEVGLAIRNVETGELKQTYRYIESNHRLSQQEINNSIEEMGQDYPQSEQWQTDYIYGYKFYKKGG